MLASVRRRISYANVIATVALFVALGGSSYAALNLPRGSVGPTQLKKGAVTTSKIKRNAVTGAKAREATFDSVPAAATADALSNIDYEQVTLNNPPGQVAQGTAVCDSGRRVVGGGIRVGDPFSQFIIDSAPSGTTGWTGFVANGGDVPLPFTVTAICARARGTS